MSKTSEKRAARIADAKAFVKERRELQIAIFESNFNVGLQMYEDQKEKMSPEEVVLLEAQIEENRQLITKLKEEYDIHN